MDEAATSLPHIALWRADENPYLLLNLSKENMSANPTVAYFSYHPTYQIASTFGIEFYSKKNEIRKSSLPEHRKSTLLISYCTPS
jgi:hypothetical protein